MIIKNILVFTLPVLFSVQALASPKSLEFVVSPLGKTVTAELDAIDLSLLSLTMCKDGVGLYEYQGPRLNLKIENETRYGQDYRHQVKIIFNDDKSDCQLKISNKIFQYSIFLENSQVSFYKAELIIIFDLGEARLRTEQGELIGKVLDYW